MNSARNVQGAKVCKDVDLSLVSLNERKNKMHHQKSNRIQNSEQQNTFKFGECSRLGLTLFTGLGSSSSPSLWVGFESFG